MSGASLLNSDEARRLADVLGDRGRSVAVPDFARAATGIDAPGLYTWFVDDAGAAALSSGLGVDVDAGLIYGGQAGAGLSTATIRSRVGNNHMRGNVTGSTFRLTLASVLASDLGLTREGGRALAGDGEQLLTRWMGEHLRVAVASYADRTRLAIVEAVVLAELDPPLNLQGMGPSPTRAALRGLRRRLAPNGRAVRTVHRPPTPTQPRAVGIPATTGRGPDMHAFLTSLVGRTILTLSGRPNRILAVSADTVVVGSSRSPSGREVPLKWIQQAADVLFETGEITIDVETVGYRSAFVGAVLAALPGTRSDLAPRRVVLVSQTWPPHGSPPIT